MTFNTTSPQQRNHQSDYRGSYSAHLTFKQYTTLKSLADLTKTELKDLWAAFFDGDYDPENWRNISINAASEIIDHLLDLKKLQHLEAAFMRKIQRTEQEQHEWEMYPDGKL